MQLYEKSLAERLEWLRENRRKPDGGVWTLDEMAQALKGKVSKTYLFQLLKGEKSNPSQEVLEDMATFFGVSPQFFSRNPDYYVPPIRPKDVQIALRAHGPLDDEARAALDELLADTLAEIAAYKASRKHASNLKGDSSPREASPPSQAEGEKNRQ